MTQNTKIKFGLEFIAMLFSTIDQKLVTFIIIHFFNSTPNNKNYRSVFVRINIKLKSER